MVRSWDVAGDLPALDVRQVFSVERRELLVFLRSLDAQGWAAPTANPGWSVHDVALHLLGNDIGRLRVRSPSSDALSRDEPAFSDLAAAIDASNDAWGAVAGRIGPACPILLL